MTGREVKNDDARFWHVADNLAAPALVGYWGNSRQSQAISNSERTVSKGKTGLS